MRIRLRELKRAHRTRTMDKVVDADVARHVFRGERLTAGYRAVLLSNWNNGHSLELLTPQRVNRMADYFGVSTEELYEKDKA